MDSFRSKLYHFLILTFSLFAISLSKQFCNPNDRDILLKIKTHFQNPATLDKWKPHTDCCNAWGSAFECDPHGRVTALSIGVAHDISGEIPPLIGELPFLRSLRLFDLPNLSGPIPLAMGKLTHLSILGLARNNLSGPIPNELGRLTNLTQLDLNSNGLIGRIPQALAQLTHLENLDFSSNRLSGPIPDSLGRTRSLTTIDIHSNHLSGRIPASLGLLPDLVALTLSWSKLTGPIPESVGSFKKPIVLELDNNLLTGSIPQSMVRANMWVVNLSGNKLTGDASVLFGTNKTQTTIINLHKNYFKFDFSNVELPPGLTDLDIGHNKIYGSLPKQLGQLPLRFIDVSYNQLCGPIPTGRRLKRVNPFYFAHNKCLCDPPLPACK